jgi:hypothetical protein
VRADFLIDLSRPRLSFQQDPCAANRDDTPPRFAHARAARIFSAVTEEVEEAAAPVD